MIKIYIGIGCFKIRSRFSSIDLSQWYVVPYLKDFLINVCIYSCVQITYFYEYLINVNVLFVQNIHKVSGTKSVKM